MSGNVSDAPRRKLYVVLADRGEHYESEPCICGVFDQEADAQRHVEQAAATQRAWWDWKYRRDEMARSLRPSKREMQQMSEEDRQAAERTAKERATVQTGPEPARPGRASAWLIVEADLNAWHPDGSADE